MAEWFANNWEKLLNVAGFVLGLLGIVGLVVGFKSWKRKRLSYLSRSNNLFSGLESKYPDVEVSFRGYGDTLKSLTVTKLAIWNSGNDTIRKQDIVKDAPLAIQASPGNIILSVKITDLASPLNKIECTLNKERTRAIVSLDYLDPKQGAVVQVFHSGTSNNDIAITGTLIGPVPIVRIRAGEPSESRRSNQRSLGLLGAIWVLFFYLTFTFYSTGNDLPTSSESYRFLAGPWSVLFGILAVFTWNMLYNYVATRVPNCRSSIPQEL